VELELQRLDLRREAAPRASTVTANLTAPVLLDVAARIEDAPDRLVCSGMLVSEVGDVVEAFGMVGLSERDRRASGDWAALLLTVA
jgi:ribosomal protein L11 methylase PrmA